MLGMEESASNIDLLFLSSRSCLLTLSVYNQSNKRRQKLGSFCSEELVVVVAGGVSIREVAFSMLSKNIINNSIWFGFQHLLETKQDDTVELVVDHQDLPELGSWCSSILWVALELGFLLCFPFVFEELIPEAIDNTLCNELQGCGSYLGVNATGKIAPVQLSVLIPCDDID
ncbi:hypothetical protein Tco_0015898 [Tanacetum coccineum]